MTIRVSLFGGLRIERGGDGALRKRAAQLLELLAIAPNRQLPRDQAIEFLWPEADPERGANNLYRAVHDLRSAIGEESVIFEQGVVRLADDVWVDVAVFDDAMRSSDTARMAQALELYRGPIVPEEYELEAVARRRESLHQMFLEASRVVRASGAPPVPPRRAGGEHHSLPRTRYARSGDVNIAYQVVGDRGPDLVFVMGWVSHLEYFWSEPRFARFLRRLASFSRLIVFDKRGTGLSDRVTAMPNLEQRMDDVRAVMVAAGSEEAILFGVSEGGPMATLFAATYPQRTRALIVYGGYARRSWAPDYPWAPRPEQRLQFFRDIEEKWGGAVDLNTIAPSEMNDPSFVDWWATYLRMSASPGAALMLAKMNTEIDIRSVLPTIRVPTLVLHRSGDRDMSIEEGRYLAAGIPGARFVELPGIDHLPFAGDGDSVLDEIEAFVRGLPTSR